MNGKIKLPGMPTYIYGREASPNEKIWTEAGMRAFGLSCYEAGVKAERKRAELDTKRYRWLRIWLTCQGLLVAQFCKPASGAAVGNYWTLRTPSVIDGDSCVGFGQTEEEAIDAAMKNEA